MKTFKLFLSALLFLTTTASAGIKPVSDTSSWEFSPTTANPQFGITRPIAGSSYNVVYSNGTLSVYLPYFGRAYGGADIYSGRSPLDFNSKQFTVETHKMKKGGTRFIFHIKDNTEVQSMSFTFFENGSADLDVIMSSRSSISFYGTFSTLKQ